MNFDEFLEAAKKAMQGRLPDADVTIQKIDKLQGESYTGIAVRPEYDTAAVTFNLSSAFDQVQADPSSLDATLQRIADDAQRVSTSLPAFDTKALTEYDSVKDHLVMQVIPLEPNKDKLDEIPHKTVEDIAVVYRIAVDIRDGSSGTVLVTNQMMERFGITPEQLHQDAVVSQMKHDPPTLKNMSEMMAEMSGGMFEVPESPIWVATVQRGVNGASVVQIPEFMNQAAEKLGGDFFVLPSSIHECLFIKDDGEFERSALEEMVQNVNATEVSEADFLSDSVYHYDSEARVFEKAETFENRVAEGTTLYGADQEIADDTPATDTITVLLVEPDRHPRAIEISTELEDLQKAVGGFIEVTYPFEDNVGLIMNEEGKLERLPLNRALRNGDGQITDIVAGSFLVAGLTEDSFRSLTAEQMAKYEDHFHSPEVFIKMGKGIMAMPVPDEAVEMRQEKTAEKELEKAGRDKDDKMVGKAAKKKTKEESL